MTGKISYVRDGVSATVTLENPSKFNAMSRAMWRQLRAVFEGPIREPGLRSVLVRGAEGHFCAGGDIQEYPDFRFDPLALQEFHEGDVWGALGAMLACDIPLVAQIQGNCMGAGLEIASCCDLRWAAPSARFGAPIARLGFPMAPREATLVAGAVGLNTARAMLIGAVVFDARHMLTNGFLTEVVSDDALADFVASQQQRLGELSPMAAQLHKQLFRQHSPAVLVEADGAYAYADHPEHREGISAFLAKRKPQF